MVFTQKDEKIGQKRTKNTPKAAENRAFLRFLGSK